MIGTRQLPTSNFQLPKGTEELEIGNWELGVGNWELTGSIEPNAPTHDADA